MRLRGAIWEYIIMGAVIALPTMIGGIVVLFFLVCEDKPNDQIVVHRIPDWIIVQRGKPDSRGQSCSWTIGNAEEISHIVEDLNSATPLTKNIPKAQILGSMIFKFSSGEAPIWVRCLEHRLIKMGDNYYVVPSGGSYDKLVYEMLKPKESDGTSSNDMPEPDLQD